MKTMLKLVSISLIGISLTAATPNPVINFSNLVRGGKRAQTVFQQETQNNKLCVIKCSMEGCGPCRKIAPQFKKIATQFKGVARFIEIDINLFREVIKRFKIKSVPSFIIFSQGRHLQTIRGSRKVNDITRVLNGQLNLFESAAA